MKILWLAQDAFIVLMRIHTLLPYCSFSTLDNFYKFSAYLELQQKDNGYYDQSRGAYFSELHGFWWIVGKNRKWDINRQFFYSFCYFYQNISGEKVIKISKKGGGNDILRKYILLASKFLHLIFVLIPTKVGY